jgi:hypothetical protein
MSSVAYAPSETSREHPGVPVFGAGFFLVFPQPLQARSEREIHEL